MPRNRTRTFKKRDYESGDGMVTSTWGPTAWHLLHTISFNYPTNPTQIQKQQYRDFILSLQNVLPCKYCRMNLTKNLQQLPLTMADMKNRETFSKYIYKLHELVNRMLKKKTRTRLSYCDVRERYEHFRSRCTKNSDGALKLYSKEEIAKNAASASPASTAPAMRAPTKHHKGCTESLYGKKSKCIIKIVPQDEKVNTFSVDQKCIKRPQLRPGSVTAANAASKSKHHTRKRKSD